MEITIEQLDSVYAVHIDGVSIKGVTDYQFSTSASGETVVSITVTSNDARLKVVQLATPKPLM